MSKTRELATFGTMAFRNPLFAPFCRWAGEMDQMAVAPFLGPLEGNKDQNPRNPSQLFVLHTQIWQPQEFILSKGSDKGTLPLGYTLLEDKPRPRKSRCVKTLEDLRKNFPKSTETMAVACRGLLGEMGLYPKGSRTFSCLRTFVSSLLVFKGNLSLLAICSLFRGLKQMEEKETRRFVQAFPLPSKPFEGFMRCYSD